MRKAGIEVEVGIAKEEVEKYLRAYLHHRKTGLPYVVVKAAISIDGRIAAEDGTSKWITPPEARADVHRLRAESQAILVGSGTVVADNPSLTVRDHKPLPPKPPLRVVLGNIPSDAELLDVEVAPTLLVTSEEVAAPGVEVVDVELSELLRMLGQRGVVQLLVEGGSGVFSHFLSHDLVNQLTVYIGSKIVGDRGLPMFSGLGVETIDQALSMQLSAVKQIGDAVRLDYL